MKKLYPIYFLLAFFTLIGFITIIDIVASVSQADDLLIQTGYGHCVGTYMISVSDWTVFRCDTRTGEVVVYRRKFKGLWDRGTKIIDSVYKKTKK